MVEGKAELKVELKAKSLDLETVVLRGYLSVVETVVQSAVVMVGSMAITKVVSLDLMSD